MKVASISGGFTIVETLIVLAVVGVLTISTITMISGRVAINRQNDALFQLESGLRSSFNDVANGKYQSNNYTCAQGLTLTLGSGGAGGFGTGGTNATYNCVYAGKKFTFNSSSYTVDTVITNEKQPFRSDTVAIANSASQTVTYPNSMALVGAAQSFFVINTNYAYSGSSSSGQQNIIFTNTYATATSPTIQGLVSGLRICLKDGSYTKASLYIATDGTLTSSTKDASC